MKLLGNILKGVGGILIAVIFYGVIVNNIKKVEFEYEVISKNVKNAEDFIFTDDGEIIISKEDSLIRIDRFNNFENIFSDKTIKFGDLAYDGDELFYLYGNKLNSYNVEKEVHSILLDDIPSYGDYYDNKLLIKDNFLYLTVGAATNSGVVGSDNTWNNNEKSDIASYEFHLSGENFGTNETGPFMSYGKSSKKDQEIKEGYIGNASIIKLNLENKEFETIAHGVRNVEGIDFDNNGDLFISSGGMEARGYRPIHGDSDYLYKLVDGGFYGWPDYSGGDAIDSAKFKHEDYKTQEKILVDNSKYPLAPIYEHDSLSSLGTMAVDKSGDLKSVNSFFVFDKNDKSIFNLNINGEKTKFFDTLSENIEKLIINDKKLYVLDSDNGNLYSIFKSDNKMFSNSITISIIMIFSLISLNAIFFIKRFLK